MFTHSVSKRISACLVFVFLLAFMSPAFATDVTRYEDNNASLVYTPSASWPTWNAPAYTEGRCRYSGALGSTLTFTFTGTGIDWFSVTAPDQGLAEVWVDGDTPVLVDRWAAAYEGASSHKVVWSKHGMTNGSHTLNIRVLNQRSPLATTGATWVTVDALDVYTEPNLTITSSAGTGGSIGPVGATSVVYGASQGFTIMPNYGFAIADVKVDGSSVGALSSYTFSNVVANHTIEAAFEATPVVSTAAVSLWSIALLVVAGVAVVGIAARLSAG